MAHPPLSEGEKTEALFVVVFFVTFSDDREYTIFYHSLGSWWGRKTSPTKKDPGTLVFLASLHFKRVLWYS